MRWSVFKGKRRSAVKKKDIRPRLLRRRRLRKVQLVIAPLFLTFLVSLSLIPTQTLPVYPVSRAAVMQASQATTVVVRLQPFAYMTQFLHTNINRAGIFHLTTSSVVQRLQFRPWFHPQTTKHFTLLFLVGCFFLLRQR